MMFLKLDYVFAPVFFFSFLWEVELEISFSTYFLDILVGLTPPHLNKKYRK